MKVDFSKINCKERPTLILRTMDGTAIQTLGYAFGISLEANYNEISVLSFSFPAHVDGKRVPGYEKIDGMKIVEMLGVGRFIINNPSIKESATKEIKEVKAYSLEYEFTFKKLTLTNSTYNFWNPAQPDNTIMRIILEKMPSWSLGSVDSTLVGKYRTFDASGQNLYEFMKGTLQDSYGCVFDFDTMNRRVNVRDVSSTCETQPIYISLDNLAKEISIEEQTENIFTCLDVNGADGVSIRSINPTGKNTIYDLSYFMTTENFSQELINKWNNWVQGVESRRQEYYNRVVENTLLRMQVETEKAALATLQGELKSLEQQQSVEVEAVAKGYQTDATVLGVLSAQVSAKQSEIAAKEDYITALNGKLTDSQNGLVAINTACQWSSFGITADDEKILDRYIREDAIQESSFVYPAVDSYVSSGDSFTSAHITIALTGTSLTGAPLSSGKMVYTTTGGTATVMVNGEAKLSGALMRGSFDYLNSQGTICFYMEKGCVTITGAFNLWTDCAADPSTGGNVVVGTAMSMEGFAVNAYITTQLTAYSQKAVEWDLYEYGREALSRLAYPAYSFSVDSGNFLAIEEFDSFREQLKLGDKLYLNLGSDFGVLSPVLIGATIDFEDKDLKLEFSDSFSLADSAFKLADLLDQSVSMGKQVDLKKFTYNAFNNAGGTSGVQQLMDTMTDLALTTIKSSGNQAWALDDAGLRLRKYRDDSHTDYDDRQIWMTNNMMAFTSDGWKSAVMGIGEFDDKNLGTIYGMVAPNIVGTLFAGKNLVIESEKEDGGVSMFRVDENGAKLYNSQFDLKNEYVVDGVAKTGQISLNPSVGIVAGDISNLGENGFYKYDANGNIEGILATNGSSLHGVSEITSLAKPRANFWVDTKGDAYFNGTVYATDGKFTGEVQATSGTFKGKVQATDFLNSAGESILKDGKIGSDYLDLGNVVIDGQTGKISLTGAITFDAAAQSSIKDFVGDGADIAAKIANGEYSGTFINGTSIYSPNIYANDFKIYPSNNHPGTNGGGYGGSLSLYGWYNNGALYSPNWIHQLVFSATYGYGDAPSVSFDGVGNAHWYFSTTYFKSGVNFHPENVSGIYQISEYSPLTFSSSPNNGHLYFQIL